MIPASSIRQLVKGASVVDKPTLAERFWAKVVIGATDECWEWQGGTARGGYGNFAIRHGKMRLAHRFSWELANGAIPEGICVLHHCDNPPCVNPAHLWLGTRKDNADDRDRKRRHWAHRGDQALRGEEHPRAKVTEHDVREIRRRRSLGETTVALGAEFGLTHRSISNIARRKDWVHVA